MYDILVLMAEVKNQLKNTTSVLLKEEKEIGLNLNEAKIKYIFWKNNNVITKFNKLFNLKKIF